MSLFRKHTGLLRPHLRSCGSSHTHTASDFRGLLGTIPQKPFLGFSPQGPTTPCPQTTSIWHRASLRECAYICPAVALMSPPHLGSLLGRGSAPGWGQASQWVGCTRLPASRLRVQPAKRMPGPSSGGDRTPPCRFPDCNDRPATPQPSELTACAWRPGVLSWVWWEVEPPIQEEARMLDKVARPREHCWEVCSEHEPEKQSRFHGKILQQEHPVKEQI